MAKEYFCLRSGFDGVWVLNRLGFCSPGPQRELLLTRRMKKIIEEEEDTIIKYLRSMWLWKNLLQQKNAGSYSSQGAAGESNRQCKQESTWETMGDEA